MTTGGQLSALGGTMEQLARVLLDVTLRTVRDRTGVTGSFDFRLSWTPDQATPGVTRDAGDPPPDPSGPSIFTALQEQLGLKLRSERGPVEILAIDHVGKPSSN
jgi:uncharacterized protein (TIGR03435 family)